MVTLTGSSRPSARATRSIFASLSKSSPYPDLISTVVTPSAQSAASRGRLCASSVASSAARVARMVERMPPPSPAMPA